VALFANKIMNFMREKIAFWIERPTEMATSFWIAFGHNFPYRFIKL